jgi:acyl-CoA-binding protein
MTIFAPRCPATFMPYYKQATFCTLEPRQTLTYHLRDAFKTNAWMQISHLTTDEAKEQYIEIINSLLKNNIGNEKSIYFNIVFTAA